MKGKEAHNRSRNNVSDQSRVSHVDRRCGVVDGILNLRHMVSNDAREDQVQRAKALQEATVNGTLLAFSQAFSSERTLYERLVGAPPVQVGEQHAGEDERPGQVRLSGVPSGPCVQLFRLVVQDVCPAIEHAGATGFLAQNGQGDKRDQEASDQQADTIDGVGYCYCLQTTEDCVASANDTDYDTQYSNSHEQVAAEESVKVKDTNECNSTRVQDNRQVQEGVHQNDDCREHQLNAFAKTLFHHSRNRACTHFQVTRQEVMSQEQQSEDGTNFKCGGAHVGLPGLAVQANQLLGRQVCQQKGTCNHVARKAAAC